MNKWTLQFDDKVLEAEYRSKTQIRIAYTVFMGLTWTGILNMLYTLVDDILRYSVKDMIVDSSLLVLSVLTLLAVQKNQNLVNKGLLLLILAYITISALNPDRNPTDVITEAYCLMMANCIILCIQDFPFGIIQIICMFVAVFSIQIFVIGLASISRLLEFIWMSLIMMYCIYKLQQQTRQFFLLSQKESNFQTILSQIATRPFVVFNFDQEQFRFKQKYNHQITLPDALNCKYNKQNFGDFIYSRQKENILQLNEVYKEDFTIKYQDKLIKVNYSEFYLSQKTFMIIFNMNESCQNIPQFEISAFLNQNIQSFIRLLKVNQKKGSELLSKICLNNIIAHKLLIYKARPYFTLVDISLIIRQYLKLFQLACQNVKFSFKCRQKQDIITIKPLLTLIIIEILMQFKDCIYLYCVVESSKKSITIKFYSYEFYIHQRIQGIEDALKYIITNFKEVPQGYELQIQTDRPD